MRRNRRNFLGLAVSLAFFGILIYFVLNFSPDKNFSVFNFSLPPLPAFFVLFFIAIYEFFTFLFNNQRRGFFISIFATLYLILRFNKLTHPFFAILILALFVTFELLFRRKR
ncbi:MAG TPA: hypothetical protein VKC89_00755 [Patescibacteria group bacterium]|nr:hypothetical protein [Patescibacteria group bacterium]